MIRFALPLAFTARHTWQAVLLTTVALDALTAPARAQPAQTTPQAAAAQPASGAITLPTVSVQDGTGVTDDRTTTSYVTKRTEAGTKTDTRLIEVPQSISVIPKEQIRQTDAQTLDQALQYTPGVAVETRGGVGTRYDFLTVRGFSADLYLNGLKLLNNGFYILPQLDPEIMERIDVFRGPTSVLYGQASAGGIIDQQVKLPQQTASNEVGLEFGNYKHAQTTFDFTGPVTATDGKWSYRLAGVARAEDGQVAGTKNERIALAPSLTYRPDADTTVTLFGIYQHDPRSTSYGAIPPQGTVLPGLVSLPRNFYDGDYSFEKFDRTEVAVGGQAEHKFSDALTVRSRAQWFHTDQSYASVYSTGLESNGYTLDRGTALSRDHADQGNVDTNVEYHVNTGPVRHVLLGGFDYQHLSTHYDAGFGTAPSLDLLAQNNAMGNIVVPSSTRYKGYLNQYGLYGQDQIFFNRFVLTLSGRQDWAQTYQSNATYATRTDQFDRQFSFRGGLTYVFDNGVAPYFSYAQSFSPTLGTAEDGTAFKPETGRQYEVGVKYQPPGTKILLTGALFDLQRNNLVTPDLSNPLLSIQSGQARSRGAELEARAALTEHLDVVAAYTYLDTTYTKDNSGLQGKRLAAIPQHGASTFLHYTFDRGPLDGLGIGGGARYTSSTFNDKNTFKVKDYVLTDGVISYDLGRKLPRLQGAALYLNGRNLLDEKYVASCYYGDWCAYGYGRQVMGGLRYRW